MLRSITLCADDFGMNDAVDAGILKLAHCRRINATSLMTLGPTFRDNAPALRALPVSTGLHLDLTEFVPPHAHSLPRLIVTAYRRRLDAQWLHATIHRQLDAFESVMQRRPHHVDGHRHVHQLPGVRDALIACLQQRYTSLPVLRSTVRPRGTRAPMLEQAKSLVIETLGAHRLQKLCQVHRIPTYAAFHGVYAFNAVRGSGVEVQDRRRACFELALRRWFARAGDGDLIMCHPADPDSMPRQGHASARHDEIAHDRTAEFLVLRSPEYRVWMAQAGVCLAVPPSLS